MNFGKSYVDFHILEHFSLAYRHQRNRSEIVILRSEFSVRFWTDFRGKTQGKVIIEYSKLLLAIMANITSSSDAKYRSEIGFQILVFRLCD